MAVIGRLRKYSTFLIIMVGVALAAFVLSDFFNRNGRMKIEDIGEINGELVTYIEFEQKVEEEINDYKIRNKLDNIEQSVIEQIRNQVWSDYLNKYIMEKEYNRLGIAVCADELSDMIIGKNLHPYLIQYFTDPQTGRLFDYFVDLQTGGIDPAKVNEYLKNIQQDEQAMASYLALEEAIKKERLMFKYNNLVKQSVFPTDFDAKNFHNDQNQYVKFRFIVKKYNTIPDSAVKISDKEIQNYYNKHKEDYKEKEETRTIEYVVFPIEPSSEDTNAIIDWIAKIRDELEEETDYVNFVNRQSDTRFNDKFLKREELSTVNKFDSIIFNSDTGTIIGPYFEDGVYKVAKLIEIQERPDSMKASHILISYAGSQVRSDKVTRSKENAEKLADSLFEALKKQPEKFSEIAKQFSDDESNKDKGGDLDWFVDGMMVSPFNEACIKAKIGEIQKVETDFGFHIINVSDKTEPIKKVKLAIIERKLYPGKRTIDSVFTQASKFAGENNTYELLKKSAIEKGFDRRLAENLIIGSKYIPGLENPRPVIRWAFEAKKDNVSNVFDLGDKYVVAAILDVKEKGYLPLERVKEDVIAKAIKEKKAEQFISEFEQALSTLSSQGETDIEKLAEKLQQKVETVDKLTLAMMFIPNFGRELDVIGTLFILKQGELSKPIKGEQGVYVVVVDTKIDAPEITDYTQIKQQLSNAIKSRVDYELFEALKENANVIDNRGVFY